MFGKYSTVLLFLTNVGSNNRMLGPCSHFSYSRVWFCPQKRSLCKKLQHFENIGPVVQLVERFICNEELTGSNPVGSTLTALSEWRKATNLEMTMPAKSRSIRRSRDMLSRMVRLGGLDRSLRLKPETLVDS